jgi:hypothetical protein
MKGLLFLALVGAAICGAIVLSYNLLPHDPAENVSTRPSLGNPDDRQLRSWGTDLPALASSSSQGSSLPLGKPATTTMSPSRVASLPVSQAIGFNPMRRRTSRSNGPRLSSPRKRMATPLFPPRRSASISPAPHYGSSADKTAGSRSPTQLLESAAGYSSNISCRPTVPPLHKPQWLLPPLGWRLSQRGPIRCQA